MNEKFNAFLEDIAERDRPFVVELNDYLIENGCKCDIKESKSGFVVSYVLKEEKKTVMNFVMRKTGVKVRLYADSISKYEDFLNGLPEKMKKEIKKAGSCKRLLDPTACNSRCKMGYCFNMDGEAYQNCRYGAFFLSVNEESGPYLKEFVQRELSACKKAD